MNDTCTYVCRLVYLILSCHSPHFISHAQAGWLAKGDAREYVSCAMRLLQLYGIVVMLKGILRAEYADMLLSIHNCCF